MSLIPAKLLVMTGVPYTAGKNTEIIDLLDPNNHCISIDFSRGAEDPAGGLIEPNTPMLCGGKLENGTKSTDCYTLTNRQFVQSETSLKKYNYWNEGFPVVNGALVVVGGEAAGNGKLKGASMVSPYEFKSLKDLPVRIKGQCTLKLDDNRIMVTGGHSENDDYDKSTWIYKFDEDNWESGPPLNDGRSDLACGSFKHQGKIIAVVAAGYACCGATYTNIVEYWVVDSDSGWGQGPPVPTFGMSMANMITTPDGKGVLFIGGGIPSKMSDEIFQLVCPTKNLASCQWKKLSQKLQNARRGQVSMLIPDSLAKDLCQ